MLGYLPASSVEVKGVSKHVGMGMFATMLIPAGAEVYTDRPLVSIQHTANRRFIKACQNCHKPVGSIRDQFATMFNEDRFLHIDLSILPDAGNTFFNCMCGEVYCSTQCGAEAHERHHYCLCVASTGAHSPAVSDFKFYCLSIDGCGDNLLLLAQLIATLAGKSAGDYVKFQTMIAELLTFTNRPFEEVARPAPGAERDADWVQWLEGTISEAFELLSRALSGQSAIFAQFFSNKREAFGVLSRLLSVFELNNIDVSIPSTLPNHVRELHRNGVPVEHVLREKEVVMRALWDDEARGVYDDEEDDEEEIADSEEEEDHHEHCHDHDHCHDEGEFVDDMIAEIREQVATMSLGELLDEESEYPNFHGTAFFVSVARTNHSCTPNVTMDFDSDNAMVTCKSLFPIAAGEELRMSYISNSATKSRKTRQSLLKDYLFDCACPLCQQEAV